jgi:hypothetical protein
MNNHNDRNNNNQFVPVHLKQCVSQPSCLAIAGLYDTNDDELCRNLVSVSLRLFSDSVREKTKKPTNEIDFSRSMLINCPQMSLMSSSDIKVSFKAFLQTR